MKKLLLLLALLFLTQVTIQAATLTINLTGSGTGQVKINNATVYDLPYSGTFNNNDYVTIEAIPTSGTSYFFGWGGDLSGSSNPTTFKLNGNKIVYAEFTLISRTLSITKTGTGSGKVKVNGTLFPLPYSNTFPHGTVVNLEAVPDASNSFTGWGGDLSGTTNPTTITMNGNKGVTADFTPLRTLTITKTVTSSGSGQVKVNGTLRDLPYTGTFANNSIVNLGAVPDAASSSFINWGGDLSGTTNPTSITMNGDKNVTARFNLLQRTLTINASTGTGTGSVSVNGTIISSFPFVQTYPHGTSVNIEAVANSSTSSFSSWSGDLAGSPASTSITMNSNKTTSAAFTLLQRTLSITKTGTGAGQVKVNGTIYDLPYSGSFAQNTVVTLEAVADGATSSFTGWGGDLSGTVNPQNITMNGSKTVTAAFTLLQRNLTVQMSTGTGSGQVKVNDTLRILPYSASYPHGTIVKLEAVADGSTSIFTGWGGDLSGTTNPVNITMNSGKTVSALFTLLNRQLMVIENTGTGSGAIKVNDTVRTLPYEHYYPHGTVVKLEAVAGLATSSFTGWSGALTGTTNPVNVTMDGDKSVSAEFTLLNRQLMVLENTGTGSGAVKVNDTLRTLPYERYFSHGTLVKLEAVADPATSSFTGWSGALTGTTNPATITMDGDKSLKAEFTLLQRMLKITKTGTGAGQVKVNGTLYDLPYEATFAHNTVVNLEASPEGATSSFTGWGGGLSETDNPASIKMNGDKEVTIGFTLLERSLMVLQNTGTGSGEVKVNDTVRTLPYSASYPHGTVVKLEAVPDASTSSFTGWGGDLSGTGNPVNITMTSNKTVNAAFTLLQRTLTINAPTGTGTGQVKVNGTVVTTFPFTQTYAHGASVNIEAVAGPTTSLFSSWSGDLAGSLASTSITMNGDKTTSAAFNLQDRNLDVLNITGSGTGQVKVDGVLITSFPYSHTYPHGTEVTLQAIPDGATSEFTGWSGSYTGTQNPLTITMDQNKSISAEFTLLKRGLMVLNSTGTGSGSVKVNDTVRTLPYSASYSHGTIVKLEAVANAATSSFTGWGGDLSGTTNPVNITMNSNQNVSAQFTLLNRKLMVIENTGTGTGSIKVDDTVRTLPYQRYYQHGTLVKLEAVPDAATSSFTGWSGAATGTTNPVTITMDGDKSIGAAFTLLQRTLSITKLGTGSGQVKVNGTVYDLPYSNEFPHNTVVNLEAVPDGATSSFASWGGDLSGSTNPTTITMNGNKSVTAAFALLGRQLMVLETTGTGLGAVKVNDTLRVLPYSASYPHGTTIKLEAVADASTSSFTGWGGDISGTNNPVNITMNSNITVSASFTLLKRSLMVLQYTGTGSGQVKVNDTLRTLPYSASYPHGTLVKLEAVADGSTSSFTEWEGDLSGTTNPVNITMDSDKSLRAKFTLLNRSLMVLQSTGTGSGQVKVNDTVRTLPYSASYSHGTVVKLEAVTDAATSSFTGWGGDLSGTTNPVNITMTSDKSVSAGFTILKRSLMVLESTGTGSGTIKVNDTLRTLPYSTSYPHGTLVRFEAVPDAKSAFTGWNGIPAEAAAVITNPLSVTMDQDKNICAEFTINQFTLKINSAGKGLGLIMVNGTTVKLPFEKIYTSGTGVTIKAIPYEGSSFNGWRGSLSEKDNPLEIKINSDMTLTAAFCIIQYKLTISPKGTGTGQVKVNDELKALPFEGQFEYDEVVRLQAVPCEGSSFVSWGGDLSGTCSNPASIKMTSDRKVTVEFNAAPCAPVLLSPVGQCELAAINPVFKWQASQNASSYNLQVSTDKCFKCLVVDVTVAATSKQAGPLSYNTCYYWRVRAGNCSGMGKFSEAAVFKTEKQPVKAPCNLVARAEVGKVRLVWSDSSDNESGFLVFRKEGDLKSASTYDLLGRVNRNNTVFVDSTIKINVTYTYKVCAFTADSVESFSNEFSITNTLLAVDETGVTPGDYKLYQNYPNPFNPSTVIRYYLKSDAHVKLTVFNSLGKEVSVLVNEFRQAGMNTVTFNARDISAGVYFYRIETLDESGKRYMDVKKLVLMK